ncbi:MAG: hypothetical protein GY913_35740 [Proteobacteria bacterium]|nr:hypothetical protein [Pseudomonadota bacterium]MCP4922285.1 hypothetical protein [Pseudomonadota bacterium]
MWLSLLLACPAPLDTGEPRLSTADSEVLTESPVDSFVETGVDSPVDTGDPVVTVDPTPELEAFDCFDAVTNCSDEEPFIEGTCCSVGPGLLQTAELRGSEVVGLAWDGNLAVACEGFGATIHRTDGVSSELLGGAGSRCQRAAVGADETVYIAHHGDSWIARPSLSTWTVDGPVEQQDRLTEDVLYEGLVWSDDVLYAATHAGGVRVYDTSGAGLPVLADVVTGFENAIELAVLDGVLYASDGASIQVLSLADPLHPALVDTVQAGGTVRAVEASEGRLYAALGSLGLEVWDLADPHAPTRIERWDVGGTVLDLAAHEDRLALATWTHVQMRDATELTLLASAKTRPYEEYEQDLTLEFDGANVLLGEWEGVHVFAWNEGRASAELHPLADSLNFWSEEASEQLLRIENRGPLPLEVENLAISDAAYALDVDQLTVEPGETGTVTVSFSPPADGRSSLTFETNDQDAWRREVVLPVYAISGGLGVGSELTTDFDFLAGDGGSVEDLRGKLTVLAYFALF